MTDEYRITPNCRAGICGSSCIGCSHDCHGVPASKLTIDLRAEFEAGRRAAAERATQEASTP